MLKNLSDKQYFLVIINFLFLFTLLLVTLFFWLSLPIFAQENDAISIRVYRNPEAYSALRWYNNEFPEDSERRGTPQSISDVDGYEAIQDGRTVYVDAGNLVNGVFHANIYTLGFSQEPNPDTIAVHADMLKHWTFNTNMLDSNANDFGHCDISTIVCLDTTNSSDCKKGYECTNNKCQLIVPAGGGALTCWRDRDCPEGLYCSGRKAEVTRRTKRYANLSDIRTFILDFYNKSGHFPTLLSGTYIPGVSLSTWPSWNDTLASDVNGGEFPVDPLNTMGVCNGYDPNTCWDDVNRAFAGSNSSNAVMNFPGYYYGYSAEPGNEQVYSYSSSDGAIHCYLDGRACVGL